MRDLSLWDVIQDKYTLETGAYTFMVGASSTDIRLAHTVQLQGEAIPLRNLGQVTAGINYDDYEGIRLTEDGGRGVAVRTSGALGWLLYRDAAHCIGKSGVDLPPLAAPGEQSQRFEVYAASPADGQGGAVEIRRDGPSGPVLGVCAVPATGGSACQERLECEMATAASDPELSALCLVLRGDVTLSRFRFI